MPKTECCCHKKSTPRSDELKADVDRRINRAIGQLGGIRQMVDDDRYCGDVLTQLAAVESAVKAISREVMRDHLETCVVERIQSGDTEVVDEVMGLFKKFMSRARRVRAREGVSPMRETFDIRGMTCAACSARVQRAAAGVPGVADARVNLLKNSMELDYDGDAATASAVVAAIEKAGYGATRRASAGERGGASAGDPAEQARKAAHAILVRLVTSAFFSVPLFYLAMGPMLGWPEVPGLDGMRNMMAWALTQLLLCVPILVANRRVFAGGFRSLWHRSPNMDSLIALGSAASFAYSLAALYRMAWAFGAGDLAVAHGATHGLYLDSAGMILTLIALGKYFEARAKGKTTDAVAALVDLAPKTATVVRNGAEVTVPAEDLVVGDHGARRPSEETSTGIEHDGEAVHDLADERAAAHDDWDADEEAEDDEQEAAVRRARNGQHVINAHRGIGDDDGLDRAHEAVRRRNMLLFLLRHEQLHGNRQENQTADCLQVRDGQKPHGHERHDEADDDGTGRANEDGLLAQVLRQLIRRHRDDDGIVAAEQQVHQDNRAEGHEELHR